MPSTTTNNLDHFALDGAIGLPIAILAGLVLLALFAWALRREVAVIGQRQAIVFWLLRTVALCVAIWMLLSPTTVRVQQSTTRRAVMVVSDVSRSMSTVDPAGTSDDLRWAAAAGAISNPAISAADQALAAAGIAEQHLRRAGRILGEHRSESSAIKHMATANKAIEHVQSKLDEFIELRSKKRPEPAADAAEEISLAERIRAMVVGPEVLDFKNLVKAMQRGRAAQRTDWRESLLDLEHRMASVRIRLAELAAQAAASQSANMQGADRNKLASISEASRLSRVAGVLGPLNENLFSSLRDKADIRFAALDHQLTPLPNQQSPEAALSKLAKQQPGPSDKAGLKTNLSSVFDELNQDRRRSPVAAVFLTTDVIHNDLDATDPRELAGQMRGTPVYVVPVGNPRQPRDIILHSVTAPNIAMRNDDVVIEASLQAFECDGEACNIWLIEDGEVVQQQTVEFDSVVATRTVRFEKRMSDIGVRQFQVAIDPLEGEITDENNFDHFEVNVTRSEIRVLLADEMPRWEYRYLTHLFRRAPEIECDELLFRPRTIATGKRAETNTFPTTVDEWDEYDVVILGDIAPQLFPVVAQESLIEYLKQRGGVLMMIAGHEHTPHAYISHPLEEVLPVKEIAKPDSGGEEFAFYVTERGRDHNALMIAENAEATRLAWEFVNQNAPLQSLSRFRHPLPTARTLIGATPPNSLDAESAAQQSAFLCWQPVKRGRVLYFSGGETYRLRFLRGDRLHYRFWGQLLRWTIASDLSVGSARVRVRTDKSRYQRSETVQVSVRLSDEEGEPVMDTKIEAVATRSDEQRFVIPLVADEEAPGQYRGEFHQPEPGVYRIEPVGEAVQSLLEKNESGAAETASFTVAADSPRELTETRCNLALARQIADATGGQVLPPTAVAEVVSLTDLEPAVTEKVEALPLWTQWKFLWIVFGCLLTEWSIRKWKGFA